MQSRVAEHWQRGYSDFEWSDECRVLAEARVRCLLEVSMLATCRAVTHEVRSQEKVTNMRGQKGKARRCAAGHAEQKESEACKNRSLQHDLGRVHGQEGKTSSTEQAQATKRDTQQKVFRKAHCMTHGKTSKWEKRAQASGQASSAAWRFCFCFSVRRACGGSWKLRDFLLPSPRFCQ
ncbi:hypothetical protein, conserved in T. vivax [Trypanosoma vivax Y486]|uniref:Uncharacterized protein n=1 Tax=Trypanosoma vivax (strain Y486) TaxID=1055687 RepID=F9WRH3_TRYVY|nr:hypothetical protein, conserved in T. vivax [Trypanosoma vivax Y486]|eukprot:CCD20157.1 hypothetical protein, conserved in T. vivax [Trypanosoma vivax Y486]